MLPYSHAVVRRTLVLLALLGAALAGAPQALAHATLLRSSPQAGAVLATAPREVRIAFDEPVRALGGVRVVRNGGGSVLRGKPTVHGRDLVLGLDQLRDGDYTVLWRVLSDDGHVEAGVFAFAVGAGRSPPTPALRAGGTLSARDLVGRFLLVAGLLLAAGTAAFRWAVWRPVVGEGAPPRELALLLGGFGLVFAGAASLTGHGLPFTRFGIAYGVLIALAVCGATAAAISKIDPPVRTLALAAALLLVPLPSVAGHALEDGPLRVPELLIDVAHLLAASVWAGGIVALLAALPALEGAQRGLLARRFSSLALDAVVVLAVTGVARAIGELRHVSQLWTTAYGEAILVKSTLLALLVALGAFHRWRLLARVGEGFRRALRLEVALLLGVVAAVALLTAERPGRTIRAAQPPPPAAVALPARDAVVVQGRAGSLALGLALRPAGPATQATLSVLGPLGTGVDGLAPTLRTVRGELRLAPCGSGCYRTTAPALEGPATLRVRGTDVPFRLPNTDAPSAAALVADVARRYDALRSVTIDERLSSGTGVTLVTRYQLAAPDSFSYRIRGGGQAVVIGARRWDRPGARGRWVRSPQTPLPQPRIWWGTAPTNAHVVARGRLRGRPVLVVTLLQRRLPAWFTVWVDARTHLPLALRMVTTAHFMGHRYSGFDRPVRLRPPQ